MLLRDVGYPGTRALPAVTRRGHFPARDRPRPLGSDGRRADDLSVTTTEAAAAAPWADPGARSRSAIPAVALVALALYATGTVTRPPGAVWDRLLDVVVYAVPYLAGVCASWQAARRVPEERLAWRALSVALAVLVVANADRTLLAGVQGNQPYPAIVDVLALGAYLLLYVAMIGFIRARVVRFHPSMWLDGLIGALGALAVGVAFLIGPYLAPTADRPAVTLVNLTLPLTDVLILRCSSR
jgi:hypothetical protein